MSDERICPAGRAWIDALPVDVDRSAVIARLAPSLDAWHDHADTVALLRDELDRIDEARARLEEHASYLQVFTEDDDMGDRVEADAALIEQAVFEVRRLVAALHPETAS